MLVFFFFHLALMGRSNNIKDIALKNLLYRSLSLFFFFLIYVCFGLISGDIMFSLLNRYVRILGNVVHAIQIKTKLCQLVEVMMERRDDLSFCQEMKFRLVMVTFMVNHTIAFFLY